jgi:ribonuclease HI
MNKSAKIIAIYTDGACSPNPGPGGWAAILRWEEKEKVLTGGEGQTTNNRMELTAAVEALAALKEPSQVRIFTDSQYLQKGITEWLPGWLKRNWRTTSGKVANQDLWQALIEAEKPHQVEWNWLRGHAGSPENSRADRLARQAAAQASKN